MALNRHIFVSIPSGTDTSLGFQLEGGQLVGLLTPDSFQGNALSFEVMRPTDGAYLPHFDSLGQSVSVVSAPGRSIALDQEVRGLPTRGFVRIRTSQQQQQNAQVVCIITEDQCL